MKKFILVFSLFAVLIAKSYAQSPQENYCNMMAKQIISCLLRPEYNSRKDTIHYREFPKRRESMDTTFRVSYNGEPTNISLNVQRKSSIEDNDWPNTTESIYFYVKFTQSGKELILADSNGDGECDYSNTAPEMQRELYFIFLAITIDFLDL